MEKFLKLGANGLWNVINSEMIVIEKREPVHYD